MRRRAHASLVVLLAGLMLASPAGPVQAVEESPVDVTVFASAEEASAALRDAQGAVRQARAAVADAKREVVAAGAAETRERLEVQRLVGVVAVASANADERNEDVGQIARGMYMYGTLPGQGLDLFVVPSGVDLTEAASTEAYFASTSNFLVSEADRARADLLLAEGQLEAGRVRLVEAEQAVAEAEEQVVQAESAVVDALAAVDEVRDRVQEYFGSLPVTITADSCSFPSQDSIAATLYAQAMGLGLGEVAAMVAIGVGLGETNLQNDTDGDCWGGSCSNGRTSSRGVFQQFYSWPPPGTAWSGQDAPTGGVGVRFDQFNASNAWGADGWAKSDPRMSVAMAANMFFLGPDYGSTMGLEDNELFQSLRDEDPMSLSSAQMVQIAQQVQQFPVQHMGSYEQNMTRAASYFLRIKSGNIPVPAFQPPLEGMAKSATTDITRKALQSVTLAQHPKDVADGIVDDGLLLVGDSLAEGVARQSGSFPTTVFGGATVARTEVGITSVAAFRKWARDIRTGPSRVLVSLGTNDGPSGAAGLESTVKAVMKAAGPGREVYWYTLHYGPVKALNAVLKTQASKYENLTLVDVTAMLSETSGYTSATDGYLHPGPSGYAAMWDAARAMITQGATTSWMCATVGANPLADAALAWAQAQFGKPYGTNPPVSYDCSKLTGGAYHHAWIAAGRPAEYAYLGEYPFLDTAALSYEQYRSGHFEWVPLSEAQPGDFIFFNGDLGQSAGNPIDHVALILDPKTMMTAEAGSPVGTYSYASRAVDVSRPGYGMAGVPKADGTPTLPGDPGWQPVAGRLIPVSVGQ